MHFLLPSFFFSSPVSLYLILHSCFWKWPPRSVTYMQILISGSVLRGPKPRHQLSLFDSVKSYLNPEQWLVGCLWHLQLWKEIMQYPLKIRVRTWEHCVIKDFVWLWYWGARGVFSTYTYSLGDLILWCKLGVPNKCQWPLYPRLPCRPSLQAPDLNINTLTWRHHSGLW